MIYNSMTQPQLTVRRPKVLSFSWPSSVLFKIVYFSVVLNTLLSPLYMVLEPVPIRYRIVPFFIWCSSNYDVLGSTVIPGVVGLFRPFVLFRLYPWTNNWDHMKRERVRLSDNYKVTIFFKRITSLKTEFIPNWSRLLLLDSPWVHSRHSTVVRAYRPFYSQSPDPTSSIGRTEWSRRWW